MKAFLVFIKICFHFIYGFFHFIQGEVLCHMVIKPNALLVVVTLIVRRYHLHRHKGRRENKQSNNTSYTLVFQHPVKRTTIAFYVGRCFRRFYNRDLYLSCQQGNKCFSNEKRREQRYTDSHSNVL